MSPILKAAVAAAHADNAERIEKSGLSIRFNKPRRFLAGSSKLYRGKRLSSAGRRKEAIDMQAAMDLVRDAQRPSHFDWLRDGGIKDGASKIGRETESRIVGGNLRRKGSYSGPK
jgi:hypothetical protein